MQLKEEKLADSEYSEQGKSSLSACYLFQSALCILVLFVIDIDECATDANNCSQVCMNELGTFRCDCNPGYTLDPDNTNCSSKSPLRH